MIKIKRRLVKKGSEVKEKDKPSPAKGNLKNAVRLAHNLVRKLQRAKKQA